MIHKQYAHRTRINRDQKQTLRAWSEFKNYAQLYNTHPLRCPKTQDSSSQSTVRPPHIPASSAPSHKTAAATPTSSRQTTPQSAASDAESPSPPSSSAGYSSP